jgi:hypothetical protein
MKEEERMADELPTLSEVRALGAALQCLASSLKKQGTLDADLYKLLLESHIKGPYPAAPNKEIFNLVLQNLADDVARVAGAPE